MPLDWKRAYDKGNAHGGPHEQRMAVCNRDLDHQLDEQVTAARQEVRRRADAEKEQAIAEVQRFAVNVLTQLLRHDTKRDLLELGNEGGLYLGIAAAIRPELRRHAVLRWWEQLWAIRR